MQCLPQLATWVCFDFGRAPCCLKHGRYPLLASTWLLVHLGIHKALRSFVLLCWLPQRLHGLWPHANLSSNLFRLLVKLPSWLLCSWHMHVQMLFRAFCARPRYHHALRAQVEGHHTLH